MIVFLLRSVCVFLAHLFFRLFIIYCLMFWVFFFLTYSVRCVSGKACLPLCRDHSVNSLLCRNLKYFLCVYVCMFDAHMCVPVRVCVCGVWVCVYLCVLGRSDLNSGEMVYISPWV